MPTYTNTQKTPLPGIQQPEGPAEATGQDLHYEDLTCSPWIGLHYRTVDGVRV